MSTIAKPRMAMDASDADWLTIPEHLREGLARFIDHGTVPGGFLTACLSNDLLSAVSRAHPTLTIEDLRAVMHFLYMGAPSMCWGNRQLVEGWRSHPYRLERMTEEKVGGL